MILYFIKHYTIKFGRATLRNSEGLGFTVKDLIRKLPGIISYGNMTLCEVINIL